MHIQKLKSANGICLFVIFFLLFPSVLFAETKSWTGFGGNPNWSDPMNWSGAALPLSTDDVLLDNSSLTGSYQVELPDNAIIVRTILIHPSTGMTIELILPSTNVTPNACTVTGPGYGIELYAGAVFRNASGLSSGESLSIADSMIIHNEGRYIHQTRAAHANSILKFLSTAPGTEQGIFDFDVPKASYTISVSNRIYGSLELHAGALGSLVNYTCTGANPLVIRGHLRIGVNVNMTMDLNGPNGNIQLNGDFIQEGGQLNLASGIGDNTVLQARGDIYQSSASVITETSTGSPFMELNGDRRQEVSMAGKILNQVGFRMNNPAGSGLLLPLDIPWELELKQGAITSSDSAMLILDSGSVMIIDSARLTGVYVDGPLRKLGLNQDHFLFPVGKNGNLRWLELKEATGNYTVEYFRDNPNLLGNQVGIGLDHISKLEYWSVKPDDLMNNQAKIELSFTSGQSGGVTDPNFLNIAKFQSLEWLDAGHTAITGNSIQGSVTSVNQDFAAIDYTLGSVVNFENPLPLTSINLWIRESSDKTIFGWTVETSEIPDHFDLYEEDGSQLTRIAQIKAVNLLYQYSWTNSHVLSAGNHFFRIRMVDIHGNEYSGNIVLFKKQLENTRLNWVTQGVSPWRGLLLIQTDQSDEWKYELISIQGRSIKKGSLKLEEGKNYVSFQREFISKGVYIFRAETLTGKLYSLVFRID
jgi:hypothetical protein